MIGLILIYGNFMNHKSEIVKPNNHLFSCIVPTLNEEDTISDFITSLHSQTYRPMELLIVDGGSIDDTMEIVNAHASTLNDDSFLIKLFNEKNFGEVSSPANARNIGLDKSNGEYVLFIDSDTVFTDNYIISNVLTEMNTSCFIFIPFEIIVDTSLEKMISKLLDAGVICLYRREFIGDKRFTSHLGFGEDREFNFNLFKSVTHPLGASFASVTVGRHFPHTKNELRSQNKWYGRTIFRYLKVIYHLDPKDFASQCLYILANFFLAISPFILLLSALISPFLFAILSLFLVLLVIARSRFKVKTIEDLIFATWYYVYSGIYFTKGVVSSLYLKEKAGRF